MFSRLHLFLVVVAGMLLWPLAAQSIWSGVPDAIHPWPVIVVIPAFLLSALHLNDSVVLVLASAIAPIVFYFLAAPLFRGARTIGMPLVVFYLATVVLSVPYFAFGWSVATQYEGPLFPRVVVGLNIAFAGATGALLLLARRRPTYSLTLAVHWLYAAWLISCAFPYMGETP